MPSLYETFDQANVVTQLTCSDQNTQHSCILSPAYIISGILQEIKVKIRVRTWLRIKSGDSNHVNLDDVDLFCYMKALVNWLQIYSRLLS